MNNKTQNLLIFGTLIIVIGVIGYREYKKIRKEVTTVYGV